MGNFSLSRSRIGYLTIGVLGILILFALRLVDIQAVEASTYAEKATKEMTTISTALAPRGAITDINGVEFARSVAAISVVVDQTLISNPGKFAAISSPILDLPADFIKREVTGKRRWSMVARNITPAQWRNCRRQWIITTRR